MQTFLPYPNFELSLRVLDNRRLGKQRVEGRQILRTLRGESSAWENHPAIRMWRGYEAALNLYTNLAIWLWVERGFVNNMPLFDSLGEVVYPYWLGLEAFHASHRSNLLRKDPEWYGRFGWEDSDDLPYVWPVSKRMKGKNDGKRTEVAEGMG